MNRLFLRNLKLVVSMALCAALFSCSAAPETPDSLAPPARMPSGDHQGAATAPQSFPVEAAESVQPIEAKAQTPAPRPQGEPPLYSLAPTAWPPGAQAFGRPDPAADSLATGAEVRQREAPVSLEEVPYASLVEEIRRRLTTEWATLSGGLGETSGPESRTRIASRLVALTFLLEDRAADDPHLEEALAFARAQERESTAQLLVAAYLSEAGELEEAKDLIRKAFGLDQDTRVISSSEPFVVSSVSLARSIEGPAKFVPAAPGDIAPGKVVLVYGEFENFLSICEDSDVEGESKYRRSFSATLKLLSASGKELDRLEFLPESRGVHIGSAPVEIVNFWARYPIPATLKSGKYKLVVEGKDILGGKSASALLEIEIPRNGKKPAAETEGRDAKDA